MKSEDGVRGRHLTNMTEAEDGVRGRGHVPVPDRGQGPRSGTGCTSLGTPLPPLLYMPLYRPYTQSLPHPAAVTCTPRHETSSEVCPDLVLGLRASISVRTGCQSGLAEANMTSRHPTKGTPGWVSLGHYGRDEVKAEVEASISSRST